jgi:hypothetical protein
MQAMRRRLACAGLILAGLVTPLLAAGPASAGSTIGCTGPTCSISLAKLVTLSGDTGGNGGTHVAVAVPPQPCLWEPIGDQTSGSNALIAEYGNDPPTILGVADSVKQAKALLKNPVQGEWYELPVNDAAPPAAQALCLKLPLYYFTDATHPLPTPPIPPKTLADYAYNNMRLPDATVVVNPANKGYVNLATYVWGNWAPSPTTGRLDAYKITATLGNTVVTVWAQVAATDAFSVTANGPGTPFSDCTATGSRYPKGNPPASAGAGTAPDCGVLWQGPDANASVSAAVKWTVSWGVGDLNGPGDHDLPAITMAGQPNAVPVGEIQSINGG